MKKMLTLLLALTLIISLIGCGNKTTDDEKDELISELKSQLAEKEKDERIAELESQLADKEEPTTEEATTKTTSLQTTIVETTEEISKFPLSIASLIGVNLIYDKGYLTTHAFAQIKNNSNKIVSGCKIYYQFFDENEKKIPEIFSDGKYVVVRRKGIDLKEGYMTDRDHYTKIELEAEPFSFSASIFECTFEDGSVMEVPENELVWVTAPIVNE